MGKLLVDRLKLFFVWICIVIDLFGLFKIWDEVKKRMIGKIYGVIFNCLGICVVYVDLVVDYSIEKFFMVLWRFVFIWGYFLKLYFDNGF